MALLGFETVRELNKRGLRIIQAFDKACYHVEFCGVNFDVADEELALCRTNEQILEIIRWKYRNLGGAMKTVQLYVAADPKRSLSACRYVEVYPGDFRWKCGACNEPGAWVRARMNEKCRLCPAKVVRLTRQNSLGQVEVQRYNDAGEIEEIFEYQEDGKWQTRTRILRPGPETAQDKLDKIAEKAAGKRLKKEMERIQKAITLETDKQLMEAMLMKQGESAIDQEAMQQAQQMDILQRQIEQTRLQMLARQIVSGTMSISARGIARGQPIPMAPPEPAPPPKPEIRPEPGRRKFRVIPDED